MPKDHVQRWIVNSEKTMPVKEAGRLMEQLSSKLQDAGPFKLNGVRLALPDDCHFVLRHERRPKGELVLMAELIWHEESKTQAEASENFMIANAD